MAVIIAPSILSANLAILADECRNLLEAGADWLHLDVMDGHFVPNLTIGAPVIKSLTSSLEDYRGNVFYDAHAMVSDPRAWIRDMAAAGVNQYTFHIEAVGMDHAAAVSLADDIQKAGMKAGISLRPETPLAAVQKALDSGKFHTLLIMTVSPGFGGQPFNRDMLAKIREARKLYPQLNIQVDGGITAETAVEAAQAGANVFVAGTYIVKATDRRDPMHTLRMAAASSSLGGNREVA